MLYWKRDAGWNAELNYNLNSKCVFSVSIDKKNFSLGILCDILDNEMSIQAFYIT